MSAKFQKITVDGVPHLVCLPQSMKAVKRIPDGMEISVTMHHNRTANANDTLWACCTFATGENKPEGFQFNSPDELYQVLKIEVGYCTIVGVGKYKYKIPKPTNFVDCPDEVEYQEKFMRPALSLLARWMGYTGPEELIEASRYWSSIKHDAVHLEMP